MPPHLFVTTMMVTRVANIWETVANTGKMSVLGPGGFIGTKDRKSTRLNSSHSQISYAVFCLKKNNAPQAGVESRGKHAERLGHQTNKAPRDLVHQVIVSATRRSVTPDSYRSADAAMRPISDA